MLIKKNEEPFFHRFLSIAKEIIKKNNAYDQQEMEFVQQPAEYDSFENMDVEEPEETYREEQELDSLMNETIIEETRGVEDEFDPMRA